MHFSLSIFHSIFHFAIFHSIFHLAGQAPWAQKVGAAPLQGQPEIRSAAIGFDGTAVGDGRERVSVRETNSGKIMRNVEFASLVAPRMGAPTEILFANPPTTTVQSKPIAAERISGWP